MPGVDGVPYSSWKVPEAQEKHCQFYRHCIPHLDEPRPADFHRMLMVFPAKGGRFTDASAVPARKPSSTRPPSMSCADCKLVTLVVARPLSLLCQRFILDSQTRGVS
eukprot:1957710-Pyramimonas_sp.AAC.1